MENRDNELHKQLLYNQIPPPLPTNRYNIQNEDTIEYRNFDYYRDNIARGREKTWGDTIKDTIKFFICW